MKYLILISLFVTSVNAAILDPELEVSGILVGQIGDKVELKNQDTGKNFFVPKSSVGSLEGYIPGKAVVKANVLPSEYEKLNPKK